MGRRSGGGRRGGGGGLFGGPRRSSSTQSRARSKAPAPAKKPVQQKQPTKPMAPQQVSGGSTGGGLGSMIMQGMLFGAGSAVAHRAVDAVAGPREVKHVHEGEGYNDSSSSQQQVQAQPQQCVDEMTQFQQCIQKNPNDLSSCNFFFEALGQCQSDSKFNN